MKKMYHEVIKKNDGNLKGPAEELNKKINDIFLRINDAA